MGLITGAEGSTVDMAHIMKRLITISSTGNGRKVGQLYRHGPGRAGDDFVMLTFSP